MVTVEDTVEPNVLLLGLLDKLLNPLVKLAEIAGGGGEVIEVLLSIVVPFIRPVVRIGAIVTGVEFKEPIGVVEGLVVKLLDPFLKLVEGRSDTLKVVLVVVLIFNPGVEIKGGIATVAGKVAKAKVLFILMLVELLNPFILLVKGSSEALELVAGMDVLLFHPVVRIGVIVTEADNVELRVVFNILLVKLFDLLEKLVEGRGDEVELALLIIIVLVFHVELLNPLVKLVEGGSEA